MSRDLNGQSADVEQALAGGAPQRAGWFRFYFADQRWEWSEQVQQMHGYQPGTVTPTTELVLSHKHPDDRGQVAIDEILDTHQAFSTRHRIIDTGGHVHHVVVVGDQLRDDKGGVIGTHGFYVDVSPLDQAGEDLVTAKLAEITEQRAVIEQVKGMLMLIYGIGDVAAFELLKWLSQEANIKLRLLAEQICDDFRGAGQRLPSQSDFDHLLLTAQQRVAQAADSMASRDA
ncbi:PAS and ANTAR domain-containing protein [Mycobacterium tilburgii]|uniref:PAS and ANTAR domain-containing protein n=1 Tax=Mycobacterium tilburgii TaxID=44467 RepID=UPI00118336D9|nr:PAS and ANTAR domain-containing protein [Mycobacterium tilburgii]